jgi:hypothetical protein
MVKVAKVVRITFIEAEMTKRKFGLKPCLEVALSRRFLHRFQNWFQEDLSRVKLFLFSHLDARPPIRTPLAFAAADRIFISDRVAAFEQGQITAVLTHEFAHIVQKRRGQTAGAGWTPVSVLEEEADRAACAFLTGGACPELSADPARAARAWGPAGHFYTAYWVARLAGISDEVAEKIAFYTQVPDQVKELDASTVGKAWAQTAPCPDPWRGKVPDAVGYMAVAVGVPAALCTAPPVFHAAPQNGAGFDSFVYKIQAGLHCLNGKDSKGESIRRESILRKIPQDSFLTFSFGLGVHAFGDSFAHRRDDGRNFIAPAGHALAGETTYERIVKYGTAIDNINEHADRYSEYCTRLFGVMAERFNPALSASERSETRPALGQKIALAIAPLEESGQIAVMQGFYPDRKSSYPPEDECAFWDEFRRRHPWETAPWMLDKALDLAELWSG